MNWIDCVVIGSAALSIAALAGCFVCIAKKPSVYSVARAQRMAIESANRAEQAARDVLQALRNPQGKESGDE